MNKLKHTPGPWRIAYNDDSGPEIITNGNEFIACVELDCECLIDKFEQLAEEQQANARLIACAPEMLDALISAYLILRDMIPCNQIKHAIESATGLTIEEILSE